jgi:acetoin utilization protein AcuB
MKKRVHIDRKTTVGGLRRKARKRELRVRDRMSIAPHTVGLNDNLQTAVDLLRKHEIRELPVVQDGRLVGIVTDRDLRQMVPGYPFFRDQEEIRHATQHLKVFAVMTANPLIVSPDTLLIKAAKLLQTYRITALPVVDGQRLVGMFSVTDLIKAFIELHEQEKIA